MADTTAPQAVSTTRPLMIAAAAAGVLLAGTLALWAQFGTAVFFEMIAAGIAACF
jgi:hypothetical protein